MRAVGDRWRRFGRIPALSAVVVLLVTAVPVGLLLEGPTDGIVGVALFAVFIVYCVARPSHRLDVFLYAAAPGAIGSILQDVFGISALWGLVALLVTFSALRDIDRETRSPEAATMDVFDDVPPRAAC